MARIGVLVSFYMHPGAKKQKKSVGRKNQEASKKRDLAPFFFVGKFGFLFMYSRNSKQRV